MSTTYAPSEALQAVTHCPVLDDDQPPAVRRASLGRANLETRFALVGSWAAALAMAWVITHRLLPMAGLPWLFVWTFGLGLLMSALTTALSGNRVEVMDRVMAALTTGGAMIVGGTLVSVVGFTIYKGFGPLTHLNFYTDDMSGVTPRDSFDTGGVFHAIVGSAIEVGIAVIITLPLGVGTAIFMSEVGGKFARIVRTIVEAMTALPSIVAGLFIYTTLLVALNFDRSGLAAGLALGVMMLPIIARASDVVLRVVPGGLREASLALGASRWRTVWHVVLPTARPGLATALILGVARGVGETSPVLLTSGAAPFVVWDPAHGVMNSLPLFIFSSVRSGEPILIERGFAAAVVLLMLVFAFFIAARLLARPRSDKQSFFRLALSATRSAGRPPTSEVQSALGVSEEQSR